MGAPPWTKAGSQEPASSASARRALFAVHGMGVERQVVGREGHVVLEEQAEPPPPYAVDRDRFCVPEEPVVHEYEVRVRGCRALEQLCVRRHARHHAADVRRPRYPQAVGAEVRPARRLEQLVEVVDDGGE